MSIVFALLVAAASPQAPAVQPAGVSGARVRAVAETTVRIVAMERIGFDHDRHRDRSGQSAGQPPELAHPMTIHQRTDTGARVLVEFL